MNYSLAVFLINDNTRAVVGVYEDLPNAKRTVFKTLNQHIAVDDIVVVPTDTRHKLTTFKIVEVDVDVDFDDRNPIKWIVDVVRQDDYEKTLVDEDEVIAKMKSAQKTKKKKQLREDMLAEHLDTIETLPIVQIGSDPDGTQTKPS